MRTIRSHIDMEDTLLHSAEEIFADEGGNVVLPCEVKFDSSKSLFWEIIQHHEDRSIQILTKFPVDAAMMTCDVIESQGFEIREPRYRGRLSLVRGNSLEIRPVARDDDSVDSADRYVLGSYRCTHGGVRGQEWRLRVRHRPDPPRDLRVHNIHPYAFDVTFKQGDDNGGYPQTPSVRVFQDQVNLRSFSDYTLQNGKVTFRIQDPSSIRPNISYRVCALSENRLGHSPCVWETVTTDALSSFKASLRLVNEPYISPDPSADENKDLLERVRDLARNLPLLVWRGHHISPPEILGFGPGTDEPNPRSVIAHLKVTAGRSSLGEVKTALRAAIMNGRLSEFNVDSHYIRINGNVTMLPSVERPAPLPPDGLKTRDIVLISLGVAIVTILIAVLVICLVRSGKHRGYKRLDTTACSISNVPLPAAGFFETEDFRRLEETVDKEKVVFVHGPSGSGKSEAASKIAESFQMKNPSYITRFFGGTKDDVEGLSEATVDQDLRELAKELEQPTDRESALVDIVYDSLNALAATGVKILLIFDDVQNISVVPREFLRNLKGVLKVIVTTRNGNLHRSNGKPFPSHAMSRFSDEDVVAFMNPAVGEDRATILELAQHFDCRPHGLSLARSHLMAAVGTNSTERYLRELRGRMNGQADAQLSDPEEIVYKAVELSVTNRMGEIEATMLKMTGFIMQNDIPILILDHAYKMQFGTDPSTDEFVKALKSLSLGKIQEDRRSSIGGAILTLSVHRQTQAALKRMVSKDETLVVSMLEALIKAFLVFFNKDTRGFQASVHNSRLLPHVEVLLGHPVMSIIREKAAFQPALVRLYDIAAYLYIQRQQAHKAKEMVERAKEICKEICPQLAHEVLEEKACSELVKTGEKIFKNDVHAQLMTHQLLTYPNIKVLRAELHDRGRPKLMQQVSFNAKHCEPLQQLQLQKLVQENAAYDKVSRKRSFLVELVASVYLTSGQRFLHLRETKEDLKDAARDFALSMKLSDYLAKNYNLYILNKMLCLRDGTLLLLQEPDGKTEDQQRKDLHKAIAGYRELFQDPTDYFENGILKKTDQDDYHAMICFRFMVQCYRKLIPLASTDMERQDLIDQLKESANNAVKFAEGYKGYNDSGKVVEVFKALPDIYTLRGDFLVEMCEQGLNSGSVKPALEDAKKSFLKVFKIKYVTNQQKARAHLGLANASLVLYEKEGRKRENLKRAEEELKKFTDIAARVSANREDRERAEKLKLRIRHLREGSVSVAMAPVALNSTPPDLLRGSVVVEMISSL
ncbi:DR1-associated protein 1 (negative cofactor 2 alpha) [Branchiostoma belcheri]|nr:DR1-associated protein 1 (negative cofactor 2 alpha) [Branchiostoma belcheri]